MPSKTIFYSRDFSQRVITEFKGEKESPIVIDYLSTGSPNLLYILIKKANQLLENNEVEKLKRINELIKEYKLMTNYSIEKEDFKK